MASVYVRVLVLSLGCILAGVFLPGLPPHAEFTSYTHDPVLPLEGALVPNQKLCQAKRFQENKLAGPESIVALGPNEFYTSLHSGHIAYVWGENLENMKIIAQIGPDCAGYWEERKCGRPLGMRLMLDGRLLVADSYLGIFILDPKTGKKEKVVDSKDDIEGVRPRLIDDLDYDNEGNIYWSDASTVSYLYTGMIELLSDPSGRLLKWNRKTGKSEVLLSNVHFANGVQLSPNKDFVLVCETFRFRVLRYWLKGRKAGTSEIFIKGLPGMPDNIRARKEGGYFVSLVKGIDPRKFDLFYTSSKYPLLRRFVLRIAYALWSASESLNNVYPNNYTAKLSFWVLNLAMAKDVLGDKFSVVVVVNEEGEVVDSWQCSSGEIKAISETCQVGDYFLFGSPYNRYIGRLYIGEEKAEPVDTDEAKPREPQKPPKKVEL